MHAQRSPRRQISENVRKLYSALTAVLSNEDRALIIQSLNEYHRERDVRQLVVTLNSVLDTTAKREVYSLLHPIIPHNDKELFHTLWLYGMDDPDRRLTAPRSDRTSSHLRMPSSSSLPENLNKYASDSGIDLSSSQFRSSPDKHPFKRVVLKRPSRGGFGFCIRGGAEHGIGLYVSSVDGNSVAENQGLLPGDHILLANDTKFDGLTHAQAVKVIQSGKRLHLVVQSVGRIPNSYFAETTCNWVDVRGRRVSPPPGIDSNGRALTAHGIHNSDLRLLGDDDERKVNLFVDGGSKLGLMIRGGADFGLGIYIAGVDSNCVAEKAGLKVGDQILDVNGRSFLDITHKEAVKVLKSTKNMILTLKDVGRVPFTRVTHDKTRWIKRPFLNGQIQSVPEVTHIAEIEVHAPPGSKHRSSPLLSSRWKAAGPRLSHEQDTENYQLLRKHMSEDTHSIQSNASSVSSFSGAGSSSSGSSVVVNVELPAAGTVSRSISASWVPEVLPANVKEISHDKVGYDVYEATVTFNDEEEETLMEDEFQRLPTCFTITRTSFDLPGGESTLMAQGGPTVQPQLDSSLESLRRKTASPNKTNGEATPSANVGNNSRNETRAKHSPPFTENACKEDDVSEETSIGSSLVINTDSNAGINSSTSKSPSSFSEAEPSSKFPLSYRDINIEPKKKTIRSQSPSNPFIFPSKYTDLHSGVASHTLTTENLHLSKNGTLPKIGQPTSLNSKGTANSPQETRLSKPEMEQKYLPTEEGKRGVVRLSPESDPRPEISKL